MVLTTVIENRSEKLYLVVVRGVDHSRGTQTTPYVQGMPSNVIYHPEHSSIYPGEYEPPPRQAEELSDELRKNTNVTKPPAHVTELHNYYKIEITALGFRREDFFIITNAEKLSITGMTKRSLKEGEESRGPDHFQYDCIQRDIMLPSDVDTEFASAEYANGILTIWLFRTSHRVINRPCQIIVY